MILCLPTKTSVCSGRPVATAPVRGEPVGDCERKRRAAAGAGHNRASMQTQTRSREVRVAAPRTSSRATLRRRGAPDVGRRRRRLNRGPSCPGRVAARLARAQGRGRGLRAGRVARAATGQTQGLPVGVIGGPLPSAPATGSTACATTASASRSSGGSSSRHRYTASTQRAARVCPRLRTTIARRLRGRSYSRRRSFSDPSRSGGRAGPWLCAGWRVASPGQGKGDAARDHWRRAGDDASVGDGGQCGRR